MLEEIMTVWYDIPFGVRVMYAVAAIIVFRIHRSARKRIT